MTTPTIPTRPTQVEHAWRATGRTAFAVALGVLSLIPTVLATTDLDETVLGAQVIAVTAAVTRVLALGPVHEFIERFLPFLAPELPPATDPEPEVEPAPDTDTGQATPPATPPTQ